MFPTMTKKDQTADFKSERKFFQNFLISFILIGYYTMGANLLIVKMFKRPVLPLSFAFCALLLVFILAKLLRGDIKWYISPIMALTLFLTLIVFINNPYTKSSLEEAFYFLGITVISSIYLYLCKIELEDYKQICSISAIFLIILAVVALYAYFKVGTLEVRVTSQKESQLYSISVARHLAVGVFIFLYLIKTGQKKVLYKLFYWTTVFVLISIIIFTGKRQALISVVLSPVLLGILEIKRPLRLIFLLSTVFVLLFLLYHYGLPAMFNFKSLSNTKMAEYLQRQYYDEKNIRKMAGRIDAYKAAIQVIGDRPIRGVGFDNFGKYAKIKFFLRDEKANPHNLWLHIYAELGIFGFLCAVLTIVIFIRNIIYSVWNISFLRYTNEIYLVCRMSICVILFSMVGLSLGRGVLLFFTVAMLMEKMYQTIAYEKKHRKKAMIN